MATSDQQVIDCLLSAESGAEALRAIVAVKRRDNRRLSLGLIARRAGIPSKGLVSDVAAGRRRLPKTYWDGLAAALGLDAEAAYCLRLLLTRDVRKEVPEPDELGASIALARRALARAPRAMSDDARHMFHLAEVFAAFGLFPDGPTKTDLVAYFGEGRREATTGALLDLCAMGVVRRAANRYVLTERALDLRPPRDASRVQAEFIKLSLDDAQRLVETAIDDKDRAFFSSNVISVDSANLRTALPIIKAALERLQAQLEAPASDRLIRFNIQIYPTR